MSKFFKALSVTACILAAQLAHAQVNTTSVVMHYSSAVYAGYEDTLNSTLLMQKSIQALLDQPSSTTLEAARKAWIEARHWYDQTEAFRFYAGPIDDDKGPEGRINAWPMDESYVDYVKGKPNSGLINDRKFLITKANLARFNQRSGEENIATGWHAIEFLLWGQDFNPDGPGERSFQNFVDGKIPNADRRRQYLSVVTELLVDDLRYLVGAWVPAARNYREHFERGDLESLRKIIVGLGSLSRGELAGERMEVALNTQDQEDEQSCFSDNTHNDIRDDALAIENVWLGRYVRKDGSTLTGPSLRDLVASKGKALADRTTAQIAASVASANAIHAPFDREIVDASGRARVQTTIASLVQQSKDLVDVAGSLGITRLTLVKPNK